MVMLLFGAGSPFFMADEFDWQRLALAGIEAVLPLGLQTTPRMCL